MKLELNPQMSFENMTNLLTEKFPQYEIKLLKNPVAKFQYIQVKKSAFSGVWIRRYEKKGSVQLINAVPSALARGFTGLIGLLAGRSAQNKIRTEVGETLLTNFDTREIEK